MKEWKKTSSKLLLNHPRISVYEDDIVLPNGTNSTYIHLGGARDSVAIIAINNVGKILIQKEYSYPPNEWLCQFPGGGIEKNERPQDAALRELSEESDITGDLQQIGWYYTDNRRKKDKQHVFIATNIKACVGKSDPEEEIENYWYRPKQVEAMIKNGGIINESMLAAWALYKGNY